MVQQMSNPGFSTSQLLFSVPPVDDLDDLAERLEKNFNLVVSIQSGSSQKEARDKLSQAATQNVDKYADFLDGLLYGILTDPVSADRYLGDMTVLSMLNADAFAPVVKTLNILLQDKFSKLSDTTKKQAVWLLKGMTKSGIANLDRAHIPFMRNLTGGENWKNIALLESYMEIFAENRSYFETPASVPIVQMAVLTFIQLIQYHSPLQFSVIKDKEMDFCLDLLRTRFVDLSLAGRELTRSLMAVCKMPKMKEFWNDLVNNPKNLPLTAGGLPQFLLSKSPRWLFAHRISTELEVKVNFMLSKVRAPVVNRYSDIFIKQYLSTPESELILPELIRFVIRAVHPSNEILGSDVLQRWNFILFLLQNCKTSQGLNNCMLALFYDWILFDGVENNIMNIEPATLLLMNVRGNSIRVLGKPLFVTLIDYLCKIALEFHPPTQVKTRKSVLDAIQYAVEKRVIPSFIPILEAVPEEARTALRKAFPEFFGEDPTAQRLVDRTNTNGANGNGKPLPPSPAPQKPSGDLDEFPMDTSSLSDPDEEVALPAKASVAKRRPKTPTLGKRSRSSEQPSLAQCVGMMAPSLQPLFVEMAEGTDDEKCQAMENFVMEVINEGQNYDMDDCELLARTLALTIKPIYDRFALPENLTDESFEDSVQSPLFILFRRVWEESEDSPQRHRALNLLAEMTECLPDIGFYLVYYVLFRKTKVIQDEDRDALADLEALCFAVRRKNQTTDEDAQTQYEEFVANCMDRCGRQDHRMVVHIAKFLYREAPRVTKDSPLFAHAVISHIDAWELRALWNLVLQRRLVMFSDKACANVVRETVKWETIEQTFFWKLFHAHELKTDSWIIELLKVVDFKKHPEAAIQVFESLKDTIPREEVFREVLRREPDDADDHTFSTLAMQWCINDSPANVAEMFAKIIAKLVQKKRQANKHSSPAKEELSLEHVLGHITAIQSFVAENDRSGGKKARDGGFTQMLYHASMQLALAKAKESASPSVREKFREVFSLVAEEEPEEEEDEVKPIATKKVKKSSSEEKTGKKRPAAGKSTSSRPGSSRLSSDEEDEPRLTRPKKHRNKSPPTVDTE
ncbi:Integrator complex subunit 3 [Hypsibius exemplaris]|uniref:SOSS complex subunit A homolog n=1 Tax=Hypsibius exemplaris TaxID=2072580 RepID=A0A1W0WT64_HYPEX|nr:Integrator complex subunit 3 [Hypsibius exemplaris]